MTRFNKEPWIFRKAIKLFSKGIPIHSNSRWKFQFRNLVGFGGTNWTRCAKYSFSSLWHHRLLYYLYYFCLGFSEEIYAPAFTAREQHWPLKSRIASSSSHSGDIIEYCAMLSWWLAMHAFFSFLFLLSGSITPL